MKDLPLSLETFSTLRENDYLYVDKTKYIFELAKPGKRYFLSIPRRFGKSLLLSTIEEILKEIKIYLKSYLFMKSGIGTKFILLLKLI